MLDQVYIQPDKSCDCPLPVPANVKMPGKITVHDLEKWIGIMMKRENVDQYEIDVSGNAAKGDGYLGEIAFVKIKCTAPKKVYNVVVKFAKTSDELRSQAPLKEVYDRETYMYTTVIPAMMDFQKTKKPHHPFGNTPRCYGSCVEDKKEAVILENLRDSGFELWDRKTPMNLEHAKFVFEQYGRWHALSLALREQKPAEFRNLTKGMSDVLGQLFLQGKMLPGFSTDLANAVRLLEDAKMTDVAKKVGKLESVIEKSLTTFNEDVCEPHVILHGDCWTNNMMFKYENNDKTKPVDMCFLDFQLSRLSSPVLDLSYYLYAVADKKVLDNFDYLLQVYHSSLSSFLMELGSDVEKIFPFNTLLEHWGKFGTFGLMMALFIVRVQLCDSDEAPDISQLAENGGGLHDTFLFKIRQQDAYDQRIRDLFCHFSEKFL